jgi:hypothetical protein
MPTSWSAKLKPISWRGKKLFGPPWRTKRLRRVVLPYEVVIQHVERYVGTDGCRSIHSFASMIA